MPYRLKKTHICTCVTARTQMDLYLDDRSSDTHSPILPSLPPTSSSDRQKGHNEFLTSIRVNYNGFTSTTGNV